MSPSASASASFSPSASASASLSPSSSASSSPSAVITGIIDDILAIKQVDNLTVIVTPATEIRIRKSLDNITIKDIEDVISGTSSLVVEITARQQSDNIKIVRPPTDNLTIKD